MSSLRGLVRSSLEGRVSIVRKESGVGGVLNLGIGHGCDGLGEDGKIETRNGIAKMAGLDS